MTHVLVPAALVACLAGPALAQSPLPELVGTWDVSPEACAGEGTPTTRIALQPGRITTFGGDAVVREVVQIGASTFVADDFRQLEGVEEVAAPVREHFRFTRRGGPDALTFVWKDVQTVELVRCGAPVPEGTAMEPVPEPAPAQATAAAAAEGLTFDGQLPIPLGLWVVAGESCDDPANAGWRVYDGAGLRGASSSRCEVDATQGTADGLVLSQLCTLSHDGLVEPMRATLAITAPRRFTLVEDGEAAQDFNWCGPRLGP